MSVFAASPSRLAPLLWLLLALFCGRVVGQALVAFAGVEWLPPMDRWMSGLMPYPYLLASQIVIIAVYTKICLDFSREAGRFVRPSRFLAGPVRWFGYVYLGSMVVRGVIQAVGGFGVVIPVVFHFVLAGFLIAIGHWHRAHLPERASS